MDSASPAADTIASLGWFVMVSASVVSLAVAVLIIIPVMRRRGTLAEHMPYEDTGDTRWITIGGFAIPALIFGAVFFATIGTLAKFPMADEEHAGREDDVASGGVEHVDDALDHAAVKMIGHQWWWEVRHNAGANQWFTSANELYIPVGRTIVVALETRDVIHSFWVPELHGKTDLIPGQTNYIRLRADSAGVYKGRCAEYCGAQHTNMEFQVVALPEDEYQARLDHGASPAAEPLTASARRGKHIFSTRACNLCHTIRGAVPGGSVGPDLTHLASRRMIAAGLLPNSRGYLEAWILTAPSLKPGTQMPAMNQFTGEEIRALVSYLETLE